MERSTCHPANAHPEKGKLIVPKTLPKQRRKVMFGEVLWIVFLVFLAFFVAAIIVHFIARGSFLDYILFGDTLFKCFGYILVAIVEAVKGFGDGS
jgi:hypothetical protein